MRQLIIIALLFSACGVPAATVREATTTIGHQVDGGKESLRRCQEECSGELEPQAATCRIARTQACEATERRFESIGTVAEALGEQAP